MEKMDLIRSLVGQITEDQLKYVECYVIDGFGVFIPSVGFCGYAIQPNHTHPAYSGIIFVRGSNGILEPNVLPDEHHYLAALLPPQVPHEEEPQDTFQRYFALFISRERFEDACLACNKVELIESVWHQFLISKQVVAWINRFIKECEGNLPGQKDVASHWASIIIYEMVRQGIEEQTGNNMSAKPSGQIEDVRQYILENYHKELSVSKLAWMVNMSESNFRRLFKIEMGQTPAKYLNMVRLNKAKQLIRTGEYPITRIALECGFSEASHFSNCFKETFGVAPSEFKRSCL